MTKQRKKLDVASFYTTYGIFLIFLLIFLIMSVWNENFLSGTNVTNILKQVVVITILACGEQLMIISGLIDLSVGSIVGLSGCLSASVVTLTGSVPLAVAVGLLAGLAFGVINGVMLVGFNIPAFIATLGTMQMARGAVLAYTGGVPVSQLGDAFCWIGQGYVGFVPVPVIIMLIALAVTYVILAHTRTGRYLYAIGGNESAAKATGIRVKAVKFFACFYSGMVSGLAGIILAARMNSGQPIAGESFEMDAITAVVVGGTSMAGGTGNILNTIVGSLIIGVVKNFMNLQNINSYYQKIVTGLIVCVAVIVDVQIRKAKKH